MFRPRIRRALSPLSSLATCMLVSACGGADKPDPSVVTDTAVTQTAVPDLTVLIQMTGLLLIVPPQQNGGETHVIAPTIRPGMGRHVAWIGFGIAQGSSYESRLCVRYQAAHNAAICYVNLDDWSVRPIGTLGLPGTLDSGNLPNNAVNLTPGSAGHRVNRSAAKGWIRSELAFVSGRAANPCAVGRWSYTPVGGTAQPRHLANVLEWVIQQPGNSKFELVFERRSPPHDSVTVTLPSSSGVVALVIAHVPENEIPDLPGGGGTHGDPYPGPGYQATHFHAFYDVMRLPNPPHDSRRLPVLVGRGSVRRCPVRITGANNKSLTSVTGIRTYGCMVAAAEIE